MEHFFERLERQLKNKLPFVAYRKPNKLEVKTLLQEDNKLYTANDFSDCGFVFSPFDNEARSILIPLKNSELLTLQDCDLNIPETSDGLGVFENKIAAKEFHVNLVERGVEAIKKGTLDKVVLSRKEELVLMDTEPLTIFKKLLQHYKSAFVYIWFHPEVGLWLGATPETLLKIEGNHFSIMALASTKNYQDTLDAVWNDKELQEQQFVTDFILDNINDTVKNIKVSEVKTVKAGNLLHLKTDIKGEIINKNLELKSLLESLHPTPAVCGLPKAKAKQFIINNENYNREFYTGFLGELNLENKIKPRASRRNIENRAYTLKRRSTQLYVNLRCVQIKDSKALIYVGGGITEKSNPESEWEETVFKSYVIKKVL